MLHQTEYERRIFNEIRQMPREALPKIMRLILLVKEEFVISDIAEASEDANITHERTRQLLSSSKRNWAQDIISDREERI